MQNTKVVFKHNRFNFIQAVYGDLSEDGSLEAVDKTKERLDDLFKEIDNRAKEEKNFTDSMAVEMCYNKAKTMQELLIFIFEVASESACPSHPFLQMIAKKGGENS